MEAVKRFHQLFWSIKPSNRWNAVNLVRDSANVNRVTTYSGFYELEAAAR